MVLLVAMGGLTGVAGGAFRTDFSLPGSESQAALDLLRAHGFDASTGEEAQIVFQAEQGVLDPAVREPMEQLFAAIEQMGIGATVTTPYEEGGQRQISARGDIAYATVSFADRSEEAYRAAAERIHARGEQVTVPGLCFEYGGATFAEEVQVFAEAVGLVGAVIILLIAFGSVLAMGLPILTALFGIGSGVMLVMVGARFITMPDFTLGAAMMMGIGVGIDYALFIVTRYRQALRAGHDPETATVVAIDTSGRAVLVAGVTVVLAVLGLLVMGLASVNGVAVAIAASVLMTMLASLTLLPAMFGFIRGGIDRLGLPHRHGFDASGHRSIWHRWGRVIQRRPWPALVAGAVVLLVLALPVLDMRLGLGDAGNRPTTDTSRRAYDLLAEGFGPGFNGPLMLVAALPHGPADLAQLERLVNRLQATEGVAAVSPPIPSPDGAVAIIPVVPASAPQDDATADLVHRLRDAVLPGADTPGAVLVAGPTAAGIDFTDHTASRMPVFFAIVLGLSFLLLIAVFRSILVPIKAVVLNLLSIGAAFGVIVAVFQWGWAGDLLGVGKPGPIEAWAPMMIFAIVFGLSMDYEVFLLSRIREEYERTRDNATAVADGLASTARVISAAAAIMIVVFIAFSMTPDRSLQLLGLGLAAAVFLDATLVRLVLVPATMELLGDRNWWMPRWLQRVVPTVPVEAAAIPHHAGSQPADVPAGGAQD
ncbi:MAG: MMPL family transporter [Sphaerobacter sp.]|nr:MMPL family transporter [Sphaerobacter sp.]